MPALASFSTSFLRKPLTTVSLRRRGRRSAVVSTGSHERRFPSSAAATLSARPLATEISIVHLDAPVELGLGRFAFRHRLHQFVLHQPGRGLPHAQAPAELDRADPALALGDGGRSPGTRWSAEVWCCGRSYRRSNDTCRLQRLH